MRAFSAGCLRLMVLGVTVVISAGARLPGIEPLLDPCFKSCRDPYKPDMINVHVVPHSHDDVGFVKTVDQYYYGSKTYLQRAGVQYILNSVINELLRDNSRRFIEVEMAFFKKWWEYQSPGRQAQVKELVKYGRLDFIGGGWTMNDEAATNYQSIVDQFTWGYRFLNETFGTCGQPKVAWQIDPFGHARGFASLATQMGLDGLFVGRIDWQDKDQRLKRRTPEMVWKTSPNLGRKVDLFTGALFETYTPPGDCWFDDQFGDEPVIDDEDSPEYNVGEKVTNFIKYVERQAAGYSTNHIMLTMGADFTYQSATTWYTNLDRLIRYVNDRQEYGSKVFAFYSTPWCYLKALNDLKRDWTTKDDDFFPYSIDAHTFWAGYFTSRPTLKFLERQGNNFLQVCKQLHALAALPTEKRDEITPLREAMGVLQHHDAITGSSKQPVAHDYARLISKGFHACGNVTEKALRKLTSKPNDPGNQIQFKSCLLLNVSQCETSENNNRFVVTIYNPLAQKDNIYIRFPVQQGTFTVRDPKVTMLLFWSLLYIVGTKVPRREANEDENFPGKTE